MWEIFKRKNKNQTYEEIAIATLKKYLLDDNINEIKVYMGDGKYKEFKMIRHGYWKDVCFGTAVCSVCGAATMDVIKQSFKYCPKCGAHLDEWHLG